METFSALLALCAGNSPVPGEFPTQRLVTRSFDVFFDLRLNKRLSKHSWGCGFETLSWSLWRHHNVDACRKFGRAIEALKYELLCCMQYRVKFYRDISRVYNIVNRIPKPNNCAIRDKLIPEVAVMTNYGTASENKAGVMTTLHFLK